MTEVGKEMGPIRSTYVERQFERGAGFAEYALLLLLIALAAFTLVGQMGTAIAAFFGQVTTSF